MGNIQSKFVKPNPAYNYCDTFDENIYTYGLFKNTQIVLNTYWPSSYIEPT